MNGPRNALITPPVQPHVQPRLRGALLLAGTLAIAPAFSDVAPDDEELILDSAPVAADYLDDSAVSLFADLDSNQDGYLTPDEWRSEEQLNERELDANRDRRISRSEFAAFETRSAAENEGGRPPAPILDDDGFGVQPAAPELDPENR